MNHRLLFVLLLFCLAWPGLTGCASPGGGKSYRPLFAEKPVSIQNGTASWYGGRWIGRKTANGERYRAGDMTAAHRRLPFGTLVRVTNLSNGKSVVVRINNRGPFIRGRIIDLSVDAAKKIDMYRAGLARVKVEVLEPKASREEILDYVQNQRRRARG